MVAEDLAESVMAGGLIRALARWTNGDILLHPFHIESVPSDDKATQSVTVKRMYRH